MIMTILQTSKVPLHYCGKASRTFHLQKLEYGPLITELSIERLKLQISRNWFQMRICKCVFESEMTNNKQENAFGSHVRGTWAEKTVSKAVPAELKQWVSVTKP